MSEELETFVNDEQQTVETTADSQAPRPAVEAQAETVEEGQPDTSSQGEKQGEPPSSDEPTMVPLAKAQAEKERRKEAEERARLYEIELARYQAMQQAQQPQQPQRAPDPYTDPEGYTKYVFQQRDAQAQAMSQQQLRARIASAEKIAKAELSDYDEYADYFADVVARQHPEMAQEMIYSPDPARFAYHMGKQAKAKADMENVISEAGSLESLKAKLKEELMAEMQTQKPGVSIPPDMSSVRSTGSDASAEAIAEGTEGLAQILNR